MADTLVVGGFQKPSVLGIEKSTTEISSLQAFGIFAVPAGPYTQAVGGFLKPGVPNAPEKSTTELSSLQALGIFTINVGPYTQAFGGFLKPGVPNAPEKSTTELSSLQALNLFTISIGPYTRTFGGFAYTGVPSAPIRLSTFTATSNDPIVLTTGSSTPATVTQTWTLS